MAKEFNIDPQTLISQTPGHVAADMDGEKVLMSVENGRYYGMDPVGSRIWELVEKETTFDALCEAIFREYEGDREQIQSDLKKYLQNLSEEKLITIKR
jgi:hypothetical protein